MKSGDLVKYIGKTSFYRDRVGVVCKMRPEFALVYYAGAERQGRSLVDVRLCGLHPMSINELEVIVSDKFVPIV